jgi:hypothetical protein
MPTFSSLVLPFISLLLLFPAATSGAEAPKVDEPSVGAIRWDAWYGEGNVTKAVETSLGQPKYHFRLPWFARVVGADKVSINGDSQVIMDQEIAYAAQAGLNYWAFLDYLDEAPGMSIALKRYLAAQDKRSVRYCLIEEGARLDKAGVKAWSNLVEHFKNPHYQTVLEGRPLLFLFNKTSKLGKADWAELTQQTIAAGLKAPYVVLSGWEAEKHYQELGFDAISEYACAGKGYTTDPETYARLTSHHVREKLWDKWKRERTPCITFATAGWDTRPRQERPPPWCTWIKATPDPTPPAQQNPLIDATTATPDELATHIQDAIQWTKANRDLNPANAIIIYGWNENDEGGWLLPTLGTDGKPNEARIHALSKILNRN